MNRNYLLWMNALALVAFVLAGCSKDDEEQSCFCDYNIIETISDHGTILYSEREKSWFVSSDTLVIIQGVPYAGISYFIHSLPPEYQIKGKAVKIKGDIYNYLFRPVNGEIERIAGRGYYCIDLIEIEEL